MAEPQGHAPALHVMRDTEVRAARLPARALPLRIRAKMELMEASIASTVGLSVEVPDRARAPANLDTREVAARRQVRVLPPRTRPRTGATAHSTARHNTAQSAKPPGHARVHVKQVMEEAAARPPAHAPLPQIGLRMEATALFTASMAVPSAGVLGRASAHANLNTRERAARPAKAAQLSSISTAVHAKPAPHTRVARAEPRHHARAQPTRSRPKVETLGPVRTARTARPRRPAR